MEAEPPEPSTEAEFTVALDLPEASAVGVPLLVLVALLAEAPARAVATAGVAATAGVTETLGVPDVSVADLEVLFGAPAAHAARRITPMVSRPNLGRISLREERRNIRST